MLEHAKAFLLSATGVIVLLAAALAYGGYEYVTLRNTYATEKTALEQQLAVANAENERLNEELRAEEQRLLALEEEFGEVSETVDMFEKLAKLDPELLQKYSKVYFLNEHYEPPRLSTIKKGFLYDENTPLKIHSKVRPFLEDLLEDAEDDNIELFVRSAYRDFGTQAALKTGYTVTYGSGANAFSADQGYSEHQLGTTVDFTTTGLNGGLDGFDKTEAYEWLLENAHKYGFVLSYPENNAYYQFEPWHWRFVGRDLARLLQKKDEHFYDLDQRDIDEYLLEIFD